MLSRFSCSVALALLACVSVQSEESREKSVGSEPKTTHGNDSQASPTETSFTFKPHTLFTIRITANQTFFNWFGALGGKSASANTILSQWADNLEELKRQYGDTYEGVDLNRFTTKLGLLQDAVRDGQKIGSFRDLILEQNDNGYKDQLRSLLPELDLGFLELDAGAIEQFEALLFRESTLKNFKAEAAPNQAGIGSFTLESLYSCPASPTNVPNHKDVFPGWRRPNVLVDEDVYDGKLEKSDRGPFARKECDDVGDILTVLNKNRILWKKAFIAERETEETGSASTPDESTASGPGIERVGIMANDQPCCCNSLSHTAYYRNCYNRGGAGSVCTMCAGDCCLGSVTWCGPLHFLH